MIGSIFSVSGLMSWALISLLLFWLWKKFRPFYSEYNIPPFPVKRWPIFGHFLKLFGNVRDNLRTWRKTSGDIYSLDIAGQLHIMVNDFKDIKEIWVKKADHIVNTQTSFADELLGEYDTGILNARDANWKEQRSTSIAILRNFGMGKNIMAEKIQEEVMITTEKLASLKGQPEDVRLLINISVSNVICSCAVGKRFDYDDPYFVSLVDDVGIFAKYFVYAQFLTPFKQLYYLPGDLFHAKKWVKSAVSVNEGFSKPFIDKFKKQFNFNEEPENFITAYLKEMKKLNDKGIKTNLDNKNLSTILRTLFVAGTETTSTTILWCLLYMLHNPHVQEKVYHEIETVVGTERRPNMSDKPKLIYLNAVINETQRFSSLVPVGLMREVSSTFEFGGYTIPKGSILWPVLDSVLHERKIWGDPENFRPERFIDANGALINKEELIPFSIGRRVCMGEALAKMELFLFLGTIFQRFRLERADKSAALPTLEASMGSTMVPKPFKLRFIDRLAQK